MTNLNLQPGEEPDPNPTHPGPGDRLTIFGHHVTLASEAGDIQGQVKQMFVTLSPITAVPTGIGQDGWKTLVFMQVAFTIGEALGAQQQKACEGAVAAAVRGDTATPFVRAIGAMRNRAETIKAAVELAERSPDIMAAEHIVRGKILRLLDSIIQEANDATKDEIPF